MSKIVKPVALDESVQQTNTKLTQLAQQQSTDMELLANTLIGAIASVKSINGKYGIVILDSGDILINKNMSGSKTIKQLLTEMENAIADTPLAFSAINIRDGDYQLNVTQGTPA